MCITRDINDTNDPQKKSSLGNFSKKMFYWRAKSLKSKFIFTMRSSVNF